MNEERFTGLAEIYAKHRPSYPDDLIRYLHSRVGLNKDSVIADIGSGTGILTELLLKENSTVYGVEPNEDMRQTAERALSRYPNFISKHGTAENTGLIASSVDYITVAQAFHWFDRLAFKAECRRVLREKGKVILVYNTRDSASSLVIETDAVIHRFCPDFVGFSGGVRGESSDKYADFFEGGTCEHQVFRNDIVYDMDGFIGRNLSGSYSPKKGFDNYRPYISALTQLFEKFNRNGTLLMPYLTLSFVGEV
jgi:SAM-dependent methyltransferase